MNRTVSFFALAGALALVAVLVGRDRLAAPPETHPRVDTAPLATSSHGSLTLAGRLSHPFVGTGQSDVFVTVDLTGQDVPGSERAPVNLAVVIDRSGSMAGEKLENAKAAAQRLVTQLKPTDTLAIVHYGSDVTVFHAARATPDAKERMQAFIAGIVDDGGTNIGAGLAAARLEVGAQPGYRVNRVILISDGQPTEGVTEPAELTRQVRELRRSGISVSSIGVGTDFNEDLMQALAEVGAGSYGYLKDTSMLAAIFSKDLQQAGTQVARDVTLSFALPEGVKLAEVLGYSAEQTGRTVKIAMTDFAAGQAERVVAHLVVTAPEAGKTFDVASLAVDYADLLHGSARTTESALLAARVTDKREEVLARRDKDASVYVARAQTAQNMQKAAQSFAEGKKDEALRLLEENERVLDDASAVAGEAAIAGDRKELGLLQGSTAAAAAPEEIQDVVKATKSKARKAFGKMSSTY